jgi:hypothetical protein
MYNGGVPPKDLVKAPVPDQIRPRSRTRFLDRVCHVSDPDPNAFVDSFYITQIPHDCDIK